ncbi:MAG: hypothetical protein AMJ94_06150 [Deltaproteobacteria bacterium SM23_61]|nr:MAG: hypothetical protein AMJ94_06150 [Deltaproteobacteria bacterium SM23_61]
MTHNQEDESIFTSAERRVPSPLIYAFFILSGMCGLVYEVAWDRYLVSFIGVSTYAHTVVLTTFMGGLALGSYLFGRFADRPLHGLRFYGWLEVGIGLYAVVFPVLFAALGNLYVSWAKPLYPQIGWLTLVRLVLCMIVLLPPTVLMGGTLPILANYLTRRRSSLRNNISLLYAANSGGAVLGTYLAGFWFVAQWGLAMTLVFMGGFNVFLGLTAVLLSRLFKPREVEGEERPEEDPDTAVYTPREVNTAVWVAGLSGAITMALEVAWVRFWGLVLGSSTYSFSLMLMAFISGIALGSAVVASRLAHRRLTPILFWVFFGTAAILLLGLPFYDRLPYWFARLRLWFANTHESYLAYQFLVYLGCFLFMFVPTVLSGMALPVAIRIASRAMDRLGRDVGRTYAVNTIGTILGSLLCGLVLLSWLGLETTFRTLFIFYLLGAGMVWFLCERQQRWQMVALIGLAGIHFLTYIPWNQTVINQGLYRQAQAFLVEKAVGWREYIEATEKSNIKLKEVYEGHSTTVAIFQGEKVYLSMRINGKVDASLGDDFSQRMTAHLPMLAHPDPKDGLVVGLGSGSTAAAMEVYGLDRVDVVELHPEVVAGSRAFIPHFGDVLARPNVHLYVDDALHFLRMNRRKYDVIASEPTNPWQSGVGNLFTKEYYRLISEHLKEGGILSQWIPTYEISDEVVYILLRTVASEFPHVEIFQMMRHDLILLASHRPIHPRLERIQKCLAAASVQKNMKDLGIRSPATVASLHLAASEDFKRMLPRGPLNYLDHPVAEFKAPEPFFRREYSVLQEKMDTRVFFRRSPGLWWVQLFGERPATAEEWEGIRKSARKAGNAKLTGLASRVLARTEPGERLPDEVVPLRWREGRPGKSCQELSESSNMPAGRVAAAYWEEKRFFTETHSVFSRPDAGCPAWLARRLLKLDGERRNVWERELGFWLWIRGKNGESVNLLQSWLKGRPPGDWNGQDMQALRALIRALIATGQKDGLKSALEILKGIPKWPEDLLIQAEAVEFLNPKKP